MLRRHGCERVQKSVWVAAFLEKKQLQQLEQALGRLLRGRVLAPAEGVLILPLEEDQVARIRVLGDNNILTWLAPPPVKIIL
jgi:CRISPR/Cas system-associated endoribonuclease Cas2